MLDTPREERFARLVGLVKELFRVPVAAVTLVDEERLWAWMPGSCACCAPSPTGSRSSWSPRTSCTGPPWCSERCDRGRSSDGPGSIHYSFTLKVRTDRLLDRLRDDGPPVPESERPMPGTDSEEGRGLAIARVALDDLVYERVDGHNEWTMVRHRR